MHARMSHRNSQHRRDHHHKLLLPTPLIAEWLGACLCERGLRIHVCKSATMCDNMCDASTHAGALCGMRFRARMRFHFR